MFYAKFLFIVSLLKLCHGAVERDLLLTPKEGLQILGKTLYYEPPSNGTSKLLPWEQTLKHVTFLTLFSDPSRNSNVSDLKEYNDFMEAPYTRIQEEYPRFGDIITMARGRVEKKLQGFQFIEGACELYCSEKVMALWRVQKIRHRDPQRGFRYEMKFSVTPLEESLAKNKRAHNEHYFKSFVLKDNDYPESFNALTHRSDSAEEFSNERQARIVNEIPRKENALRSSYPQLNIGEYFKEVPKASSKVGYLSSNRPVFPTTYRPNYNMKFAAPVVEETTEAPKTVVTHHYHHHYFMKDPEPTLQHGQPVFHGKADAIRIIEAPNTQRLTPQYTINVHPPQYSSTTPAPPPQTVFYMHQIPLYIQSFPQEDTTSRQISVKPFRQSEQQFEEIRYSEPDPLYENVDRSRGSSESASDAASPQVERPGLQFVQKPNSIISQLPPAAEDQDTRVPYVDDDDFEEQTTNRATTTAPSTRRTLLPKNKYFVSTSTSETPLKHASKITQHKNRHYQRTTTEQPVLRWKPRRKPATESSAVQSSTEEKVITVTPSKEDTTSMEVITHKSVSKSISVKVGNHSEEVLLAKEPAATVSGEVPVSDEAQETNP